MELKNLLFLVVFCLAAANEETVKAKNRLQRWCQQTNNKELQTLDKCMAAVRKFCETRRKNHSLCRHLRILEGKSATTGNAKESSTLPPSGEATTQSSSSERPDRVSRELLRNLKVRAGRVAYREQLQLDRIRGNDPNRPRHRRNEKARRQRTENDINDPNEYWAGDVDLTNGQAAAISNILQANPIRRKRKVGQDIYLLWRRDKPISYFFSDSVPEKTRKKILDAIHLWEENTCVRFREDKTERDKIEFVNGRGCSSYVGRVEDTQQISVRTPGCDFVGIISHEIGHSLGFFHEQARPDRDRHLNINMNNVNFWFQNNFAKAANREVNSYNQPYDYGSIMHYDAYSFAENKNIPTIETLEDVYQTTIGQRALPSFVDFAQVNGAYCEHLCPITVCAHGGYPDPNDCPKCKCPMGLGGPSCEVVQSSTCGGELESYQEDSFIQSPNYPQKFQPDSECIWFLKTDKGHHVYMEFVDVFRFDCKDVCDENYIEIKRGDTGLDFRRTGARFCCSERPQKRFVSQDNEMIVIFKAFDKVDIGFRAKFWTDAPRHKATTSTTTTTTTTIEPTTQQGQDSCRCENWGRWSRCSQVCGGCGSRERRRSCEGSATCETEQSAVCNQRPCWGRSYLLRRGQYFNLVDNCCEHMKRDRGRCVEKESKKTTTTTTTTPAPLVPDLNGGCSCGPWSEWGTCSQYCGGCGKSKRTRTCPKADCFDLEVKVCGMVPCSGRYLWRNGEFHVLRDGCCIRMRKNPRTWRCDPLRNDEPELVRSSEYKEHTHNLHRDESHEDK